MAEIGRLNSLEILHHTPQGFYLDGAEHGEILLPSRYVTDSMKEGNMIFALEPIALPRFMYFLF
ncbi:S1 RNA-binding domain-containing protein [Verrucomicrobia bacterium]|nr:S1 RNA-binding domain-containing protein [Verrucomicrobiota bacterium]